MHVKTTNIGSITSRCSGNEPALLPERTKSGLESAAEVEPTTNIVSSRLKEVLKVENTITAEIVCF